MAAYRLGPQGTDRRSWFESRDRHQEVKMTTYKENPDGTTTMTSRYIGPKDEDGKSLSYAEWQGRQLTEVIYRLQAAEVPESSLECAFTIWRDGLDKRPDASCPPISDYLKERRVEDGLQPISEVEWRAFHAGMMDERRTRGLELVGNLFRSFTDGHRPVLQKEDRKK